MKHKVATALADLQEAIEATCGFAAHHVTICFRNADEEAQFRGKLKDAVGSFGRTGTEVAGKLVIVTNQFSSDCGWSEEHRVLERLGAVEKHLAELVPAHNK